VTPNFDDFLSRALTLFGQPHIVCDHPNTVERIDPESSEIQLVHVHGTYWFYDGCNLRAEIEARTEDSRERSVTMQSLLDNVLSRHSALVVGYAGWEGDAIMTALVRRLKGRLRNNLYWFCYRRSDADSLPIWLKEHRDVRLVLPPALPSKPAPQPASEAGLAGVAKDPEPTLPAQSVLDKLVGAFTEKSPALTLDPIGFFAEQLTKSFPPNPSENVDEDIYKLLDVIRRVELVREAEEKPSPIEAEIEHVRDAVRRSAYLEALQTASQVEPKLSTDVQREMLMESVMSAALGLNDNSEAELGGYDLVVRLASGEVSERPRVRERVARALFTKGLTLGQLNRNEEAIQSYDEVLGRFGDAVEPTLRDLVARALFSKAVRLSQLNRVEEEIQTYDEMLRRFGGAAELALRELIAQGLYNKGYAFGQLNRDEEAIQAYSEVLRQFGEAPELELREPIARSLVSKGARLGKLNRSEEEIQSYDEVLRRFGDATELAFRELVATALVNKATTLGQLNRGEEEIQTYDEAVRRFGDATEPPLRETVARALFNKSVALVEQNRAQDARASFEKVLKYSADSSDAALLQLAEKAQAGLKSLDARKANQ